MNKKVVILSTLIVVTFLFASCTSTAEIPVTPVPNESTNVEETAKDTNVEGTVADTPIEDTLIEDTPIEEDVSTNTTITYEVKKTEVDSIDDVPYLQDKGDMIIPSSVHLRNCDPGMSGKWESKVYNSSLEAATYTTAFKYPDLNNLKASAPPEGIENWVTIENPLISMEACSEGVFHYRIEIPENVELPEVSEFWVVVKKADQKDFVQWEVFLRCYMYRGG